MRSKRKSSDLFKRTKHWNGIEIIRINGDFSHSLATMEWEAAAAAAAEIDNNKKCSHDDMNITGDTKKEKNCSRNT